MVAIKQIGTNGGGFFATGSAHPFENPNKVTNYLEMLAIILIPAALCYTFGILVNDRRQGWVLLIAMLIIFIPLSLISMHAEQIGNPLLNTLQIENIGNMEGKEQRIGPLYSALWGAASTATSNGSVNYMFDSAMPISGFVYMVLMDMGGVIFGGVGCGIYGTLLIVIITVFVAGLMVGRTPEYLGKKIEPYEMKLVSFMALILSLMVVFCTAIACSTTAGASSIHNPGAHGFSEILYAFTSMRNNNGSAFAGLNVNTYFYNILGGVVILIGRYWLIIGLLAVANSLATKKRIPSGIGTLPTHDSTFLLFLIGVIIVVGTLSFLPALA
jgi:K+-transporting ATPase ATPase A chain